MTISLYLVIGFDIWMHILDIPGINGCHSNKIWRFRLKWNFHRFWLLGNENCNYFLLHFFKTLLTHCLIQLEK